VSAARRLRAEVTAPLARWGSAAVCGGALLTGHAGLALAAGCAAFVCWTVRPPRRTRR